MTPKLKPPGTKLFELNCDTLISTSAFRFNLRLYTMVVQPQAHVKATLIGAVVDAWAVTDDTDVDLDGNNGGDGGPREMVATAFIRAVPPLASLLARGSSDGRRRAITALKRLASVSGRSVLTIMAAHHVVTSVTSELETTAPATGTGGAELDGVDGLMVEPCRLI